MMKATPAARATLALRVFGATMIVIGLAGYLLPAATHWTALIPAIIGAIALAASLPRGSGIAQTVVAAVLAGITLFGTASALPLLPALLADSGAVADPAAVGARAAAAIAALLLLVSLVLIRPWQR